MTATPTLTEPFGPLVAELRLAAERARQHGGIASIEARLLLVFIAILGTLEALYLAWKASLDLPEATPAVRAAAREFLAGRTAAPSAPRAPRHARHPSHPGHAPVPAPMHTPGTESSRHNAAGPRPRNRWPAAAIPPVASPQAALVAACPRHLRPPWQRIPKNASGSGGLRTSFLLRYRNK